MAPLPMNGTTSGRNRPAGAAYPPAPVSAPSATSTVTVTGGLPHQRQQQQQAQALAARSPFATCSPSAAPPTAGT